MARDPGSLYYPADATNAPLVFLVHGNHGSCHVSALAATPEKCGTFNRNDTGYAYLAHNLASWGYVVFSLDQDQLMVYQDGSHGKGMHQRRLLIAAALDSLYALNQPIKHPIDNDNNVGDALVGKIDFSRIGMMGHSRPGQRLLPAPADAGLGEPGGAEDADPRGRRRRHRVQGARAGHLGELLGSPQPRPRGGRSDRAERGDAELHRDADRRQRQDGHGGRR
jgi:hypothetical protein